MKITGKTVKLWLCGLLAILSGGCALMSSSYVEPVEYDWSVPADPLTGVRFELGSFRNLSGSDRRFLYRERGGKMLSDDYNRWLLSPDLMLERQLHKALSPQEARSGGRSGRFLRLSGTIYRCEFDREKKTAALSVDYRLQVFVDRRPAGSENLIVTVERPIQGNTPAAAADAMSECVSESIASVRDFLIEANKEDQKTK